MPEDAQKPGSSATALEREARSARVFVAKLRSDRLGEQSVIIRNISPLGISARLLSGHVEPGERVTVILNEEEIAAEVRWARKNQFGARLFREVDPSAFNFSGKSWETVVEPLGPGHVFDQFKPVSDFRRPGLKTR
jgi:hypothetical protein